MGVEFPEIMSFIAGVLGLAFGVFMVCCFFIGYILGPEKVPPLTLDLEKDVNDQDLFAVATGNEEYLAAHCTLPPTPDKVAIDQEKLRIQQLKNQIARMKLERELEQLKQYRQQPPEVPKSKPITVENHECDKLFEECVSALVVLGYKNNEARKMAGSFFQANPDVKTVDQFISGVFKR